MRSKYVLYLSIVVVLGLCGLFGINGYYDYQKTILDNKKEVLVEQERTERTEERSQFWQKIVPWGEDESEENK